ARQGRQDRRGSHGTGSSREGRPGWSGPPPFSVQTNHGAIPHTRIRPRTAGAAAPRGARPVVAGEGVGELSISGGDPGCNPLAEPCRRWVRARLVVVGGRLPLCWNPPGLPRGSLGWRARRRGRPLPPSPGLAPGLVRLAVPSG